MCSALLTQNYYNNMFFYSEINNNEMNVLTMNRLIK